MCPRAAGRWRPSADAVLVTTVVAVGLFATGVGSAPHTPAAALVYDVLLFDAVHVGAAVLCLAAARRVPEQRTAWRAAAAAWLLVLAGNLVYAVELAVRPHVPFPSFADVGWFASYPFLCVVLVALTRVRVPHVGPSAWLDGLIGALGITAVSVAVFIGPALEPRLEGAAAVAALAYPVADTLLLALWGAVAAVLGLRLDRTIAWLTGALACKLVGDLLLSGAQADGGYVPGGPIDLTWMAAAVLTGLAAREARPRGRRAGTSPASRTGWQVLAVPLACNVVSLAVLGTAWGDGTVSAGEVCALACVGAALVRTAVTFAEVRALADVREQAATDELTGLPNRRALLARLGEVVAGGRPAALLLIDLDGFKAVNDTLGHRAGDELLRRLGARVRPALRPEDTVARLGGDEFAVVLPDAGPAEARECAARLHRLVVEPVPVEGTSARVGASIGVVAAPLPADAGVAELLRRADVAMYAAKSAGGGVRSWSPDDDGPRPDPAGRERGTRGAPSAAAAGGDLDAVLDAALGPASGWWTTTPVPVVVQLSPAHAGDPGLGGRIEAALQRHGLPPAALAVRLPGDSPGGHDRPPVPPAREPV